MPDCAIARIGLFLSEINSRPNSRESARDANRFEAGCQFEDRSVAQE